MYLKKIIFSDVEYLKKTMVKMVLESGYCKKPTSKFSLTWRIIMRITKRKRELQGKYFLMAAL